MVQHLSARCSQLPGDSYDTVAETDEEGGLSHRWRHPAPPSDRQRMAGSLRRIAMVGTALVLGVAAVYALRQTARSGLGESLLSAQQLMGIKAPQCLRDEEEFAGLCYMKCSLLTGGRAPFRVAASACCVNDNQFFCSLLQSQQAISNSLSVGGGAAIHNNPHAPGVGGICALVEEAYQGLCYPKCADLTDGKSAHRVGAFACCAGSRVECLNGKGTISTSPDFGGSVIPEAKDTGRSYKAINIMDARCDHDEDEFNGLCYTKCSELTYGKSTLRTGPGSCCNCGKGFFSGLCCMIPWNVVTDPSFTVGMSSNGEPSDPHPPGMRVKCSSEEEEFEGICYEKCSTLTKGQLPYRLSSVACCKFPGQAACHNLQNEVVNINLNKSQDLSVSIERYIAVIYSLRYRSVVTGKRSLTAIAVVWILGISLNSLFFVTSNDDLPKMWVTCGIITGIAMTIILVCYAKIFLAARAQSRRIAVSERSASNSNSQGRENSDPAAAKRAAKEVKRARKAAWRVGVTVVAVMFLSMPVFVVGIIQIVIRGDLCRFRFYNQVWMWSTTLSLISSALDPWIYAIGIKEFRDCFKQTIYSKFVLLSNMTSCRWRVESQ